ncbi:DegT/DnrJ/EryC1/StrS family aminotransferase [Enterovibrio norvegicus]|uniref:DegT/DnrJ/EryC1/StrS family aminotransferase n=1 Tax=Enterovibrio norvegicus TaxID=188144 RepID=UPI00389AEAC0
MQFIDLDAQYKHLKRKIDSRIQNVLQHGGYIMGPEVFELEEKLAEYVGVKHAITCANGTDALTLALMALGIGKGDAVFCPTFTFFATAESIAFLGATPIFVDSEFDTFNMCTIDLERKIEKAKEDSKLNIKAILAVDLFGLPANYPEIERIAKLHNIKVIEDAAQGFGGTIKGRRAGSFGDIATTSFFPAKPLGCYGDGGAIFTNNDEYATVIKSLRIHGKGIDKYDNILIGMNSRLDTIQAAILLEKLDVFPEELEKRQQLADIYSEELRDRFIVPTIPEGYTSSWAQYTVKTEEREEVMRACEKRGIPTMVYYRTCLHKQTAFKNLEAVEHDCPNAETLSKQVLSLPMHPYLNKNVL